MAVIKTYRKLIPVSTYDIAGVESWLSDMAGKGFFLYDLGAFLARFTKGDPKVVRYRLEPAGKDPGYPNLDLKFLYEENGWRFVSPYKELFHVFMTEDAAAPELHTDPLVQSATLKKMDHQLLFLSLAYLVLPALLILLSQLLIEGNRVYTLLLKSNIFQLILIPLYLIVTVYMLISTVRISKLRCRLRAGRPFEHYRKNSKRTLVLKIMELTGFCAFVLIILSSLANLDRSNASYQPLSEIPSGMPFLSLEDLDPEQFEDYSGCEFSSDHSPFVPEQYTVRHYIQIDPGHNRSVLQTYYYQTAFTGLAKPLFDEMIRVHFRRFDETAGTFATGGYDTLNTPLFDEAVYAYSQSPTNGIAYGDISQYIIAYRDKTVVVVRYEGDADLRDKLEAIAGAFF
jgi:hypothetical protein